MDVAAPPSFSRFLRAYDTIVSHGRANTPANAPANAPASAPINAPANVPNDEPPWSPKPKEPTEYHSLPTLAGYYTELTE
jgi:hypothetical protein